MNVSFANKVALITGGAQGIGLATAIRFRNMGAKVMIVDLQKDAGESAAAEHDLVFHHGDISKEEDVKAMMAAAVDRWERLDIVVANAAIKGENQDIEALTVENWEAVNAVDYTGVFLTTKYAMQTMHDLDRPGSIINLSSLWGTVGMKTNIAYSTAKGALINFTRAAGTTYLDDGIRVNSVAPGVIESSKFDLQDRDTYQMLAPTHPVGTIDDVVDVITFLASDYSKFVNGATIPVDGGYVAM